MASRVHSLSSLSGQASCWPTIAEIPLQRLKSAEVFVFCTRAGVSEQLIHDEWGGVFVSFRKDILCVQRTRRNDRAGTVAVRPCVTRTAVVCRVNVGRDWGHTPVWAGHERGIGCPWSSEESNKLELMLEGPWLGLPFPCEGWAWGGQRSLMSSPRLCGLPRL